MVQVPHLTADMKQQAGESPDKTLDGSLIKSARDAGKPVVGLETLDEQIDAFKALVIPEKMQRRFGYPPLTKKAKARILGLNAAKLYGVDPKAARCTIASDALARLQAEQGGVRASRTHRVYGPRTRASYEALLAHAAGRTRPLA